MKANTLIKAIEKTGLTMSYSSDSNRVVVIGQRYFGEFFIQGDLAVAVNTSPVGQDCETFHKTIKSFIQAVVR